MVLAINGHIRCCSIAERRRGSESQGYTPQRRITQAYCRRIIVQAEMRMADTMGAGKRVKSPRPGGDTSILGSAENAPAKVSELGVSPQRLAKWRDLRDAGEAAVEAAIQAQLAALRDGSSAGRPRAPPILVDFHRLAEREAALECTFGRP
jgi:hypothetical protein